MNTNYFKTNKMHFKVLIAGILFASLIIIPKVMAMSLGKDLECKSYGVSLFLLGISSAGIGFAQKNFARIKKWFDLLTALIGIVLSAPFILVFALLIKIFSPEGGVFYTQQRVGRYGRLFKIYKLRSMKIDSEKHSGAVWAQGKGYQDPRVIPVIGSFLRKSHIDELPQFFNVLKGDMSIVGPRPERPEIIRDLVKKVPDYRQRLSVKPGITGLAQVHHRYDQTLSDVKKKLKFDILYIKKMCLFMEIAILIKTAIVVLKGKTLHWKLGL
ncbi:MAG: sugar transferase [Candidatus Omnitrophota bacterium]|nr:MAG: sugar transferase [Candidatus Omnitrophota bacterium]